MQNLAEITERQVTSHEKYPLLKFYLN